MNFVIRIFESEDPSDNDLYINDDGSFKSESEFNDDSLKCKCYCNEKCVKEMYDSLISSNEGYMHMVRNTSNNDFIIGGLLEPGCMDILKHYLRTH